MSTSNENKNVLNTETINPVAEVETSVQTQFPVFVHVVGRRYSSNITRMFYAFNRAEVLESLTDMRHVIVFEVADIDSEHKADWNNGRLAADFAAVRQCLKDSMDYQYSPLTAWKGREESRLENGDYRKLHPAIQSAVSFNPAHYVHYSVKNTANEDGGNRDAVNMIAYTESEDKGQRDKQTVCTFGRYLKKFHADLSDSQIEALVVKYRTSQVNEIYSLKTTTDMAVISAVYETQMGAGHDYTSCMYGKFTWMKVRPYHVYADSPDVALAYMVDDDGKILARSLVTTRENRLGYVRLYATNEQSSSNWEAKKQKFLELLQAAGYGRQRDLEGCRITKQYDDYDTVIAPYIDGGADYLHDSGDYWLVSSDKDGSEYQACETSGYPSGVRSTVDCYSCDGDVDRDDVIMIGNRSYCRDCVAYCDDCEEYTTGESMTAVNDGDRHVCDSCLSNNYVEATDVRRGSNRRTIIWTARDNAVEDCNGEYFTDRARDYFLTYFESDEQYHDTENCNHTECEHYSDGDCSEADRVETVDSTTDDDGNVIERETTCTCECTCDGCETFRSKYPIVKTVSTYHEHENQLELELDRY